MTFDVSGERLVATYLIKGDEAHARDVLALLCVEQTIEFPLDLVSDTAIKDHLVGRVERLRPAGLAAFEADVSFAVEVSGFELPQLTNLLFGNISLMPGIRLVAVDLPASLLDRFAGPRYGVAGLRELVGAPDRPLVATALKPMGLPLDDLAAMAGDFATHGMDLIKDGHGFGTQPYADFRERVQRCADAVATANDRHGTTARYVPSLNVLADRLRDAAGFARDAGAGGVVVLPGLHGFDAVRALADDDELALPILGHPALLGAFVAAPASGIGHSLVFGTFMRLAGADASVFPHAGGRFAFTDGECRRIATALAEPFGGLAPAFPAPAGGITLERIPEIIDFYGRDVVLLIGAELQRGDRRDRTRVMRDAVA